MDDFFFPFAWGASPAESAQPGPEDFGDFYRGPFTGDPRDGFDRNPDTNFPPQFIEGGFTDLGLTASEFLTRFTAFFESPSVQGIEASITTGLVGPQQSGDDFYVYAEIPATDLVFEGFANADGSISYAILFFESNVPAAEAPQQLLTAGFFGGFGFGEGFGFGSGFSFDFGSGGGGGGRIEDYPDSVFLELHDFIY
jgi:hypothetical protein